MEGVGTYPSPLVLVFDSNSTMDISQQTFVQLPDSNNLSDSRPAGKVADLKVRVGHVLPQAKLGIHRPISQGIFLENFEMHWPGVTLPLQSTPT